jgi:hypothetical protein
MTGRPNVYLNIRGIADNAYPKARISSNDVDSGIPTPRTASGS